MEEFDKNTRNPLPATTRLYRQNVYLKETDARLLALLPVPEKADNAKASATGEPLAIAAPLFNLVFDRSPFFPIGGGQSSDIGEITFADSALRFLVESVHEKDGIVYHRGRFSSVSAEEHSLQDARTKRTASVGEKAHLTIDWSHRFDNMQRHCGEHILSGVLYKLYRGINRGFHMGEDYMTVDISLEESSLPALTLPLALRAEEEVNRIIWKDLPVTTTYFTTQEAAEGFPVRKKVTIPRDITIVTVGSLQEPADSVACCGTHPSTSGQVGLLKVYKVEPNKGMFRIYFEAGMRAYRAYAARYEVLSALEKDLSAGFPDLLAKYRARKEKEQDVRDRLYALTEHVLSQEKEAICADIAKAFSLQSDNGKQETYGYSFAHLPFSIPSPAYSAAKGQIETEDTVSPVTDTAAMEDNKNKEHNGYNGHNKNNEKACITIEREYKLFSLDDLLRLGKNCMEELEKMFLSPVFASPVASGSAGTSGNSDMNGSPAVNTEPVGKDIPGMLTAVPVLLLLSHLPSHTVLLFSDARPCGKLVKEQAPAFSGKGGGKPNFARAVFQTEEDRRNFIRSLPNALQRH